MHVSLQRQAVVPVDATRPRIGATQPMASRHPGFLLSLALWTLAVLVAASDISASETAVEPDAMVIGLDADRSSGSAEAGEAM